MPLISENDQAFLRDKFASDMANSVKMVFFTQKRSPLVVPTGPECEACEETQTLLEEVAGLSDKISLETHDFVADAALARSYGVDKIPATLIINDQGENGLRFFGIPAGYEFASLIEDIIDVSRGGGELTLATKDSLAQLKKDVHIQVFVTPT